MCDYCHEISVVQLNVPKDVNYIKLRFISVCSHMMSVLWLTLQASITIKKTAPCFSLGMEDWLTDMDNYLFTAESSNPTNEPEVCAASESLLLSQEDIYQLDEEFQASDTELL